MKILQLLAMLFALGYGCWVLGILSNDEVSKIGKLETMKPAWFFKPLLWALTLMTVFLPIILMYGVGLIVGFNFGK